MADISPREIDDFSRYVYDISGIVLDESKGYLLETRLRPLLAEPDRPSFADLLRQAKADASGRLAQHIIDAIATNETFFFRDTAPFELLRNKILPELIDRRLLTPAGSAAPIRIWSAACSSGQEVYSIAMTVLELFRGQTPPCAVSILGSDISDSIIARASYGKYSRFEIERGLPPHLLHRYFTPLGTEWRIKDEVRALAKFQKLNLLQPFPDLGRFDIVFCRNVAIYFSTPDRQRLFQKIARVMATDGALLVGGSESLSGAELPFVSRQYLKGIYYQLPGEAATAAPMATAVRRPATPPRPMTNLAPPTAQPRPRGLLGGLGHRGGTPPAPSQAATPTPTPTSTETPLPRPTPQKRQSPLEPPPTEATTAAKVSLLTALHDKTHGGGRPPAPAPAPAKISLLEAIKTRQQGNKKDYNGQDECT